MGTEATILHADLDAFYASVKQLLNPNLRRKPIAASYEANAFACAAACLAGRRVNSAPSGLADRDH